MADSLYEWQVCKIRNFSTLCYWPFKGRGPRAVLILCCFAVYSTGRFMFSLALFFVLVLFSVILALWSHYLGKRELRWTLIFTLPIFSHVWTIRTNTACEEFARIRHRFQTNLSHTCDIYVLYQFYRWHECEFFTLLEIPLKKLPFCYVRIFHVYFIIFLITL